MSRTTKPHILFVVNVDWFFVSHRLPLATYLQQQGWQVSLITQLTTHASLLRSKGIQVVALPSCRGKFMLLRELQLCYTLWKTYRALQPCLIHQVGLKLIVYGTIANSLGKCIPIIQAVSGLGSFWHHSSLLKHLCTWLRPLLANTKHHWVFQNTSDVQALQKCLRLPPKQIHLIKGVGVDTQHFCPQPFTFQSPIKVVLIARMIKDKGVLDFIQAAQNLKPYWQGKVQFELIGGLDSANPSAIEADVLEAACMSNYLSWRHFQEEIKSTLATASIVVLPSYHEGFPKVLLEASAMEKAIIASDCAGCRSLITHRVNGLLFPVGHIEGLTTQIDYLLKRPFLRKQLGQKARQIVLHNFTQEQISQQFSQLFQQVLHTF